MPFGYGTRTQQYIDVSDAGPNDRIKVTLENGQIVILLLPAEQLAGRRDTESAALYVDKQLTEQQVLEPLYRHAVNEARRYTKWRERQQYTLEAARRQVEIRVSVRSDEETFDDSPHPGEHLDVISLFPQSSGLGSRFSSPVKTVEFITI